MQHDALFFIVGQVLVVIAVMIYLLVIEGLSLGTILYNWGVPIAIFTFVFLAYPVYQLLKNLR